MLVLSRKRYEQIDIDGGFSAGGLTITIVDVDRGKVRIGIQAPQERKIYRREINPSFVQEQESKEAS